MHDLPLLTRQALDRIEAGEDVTLNRPLFAATLVALTQLPRKGVDTLRAQAEIIFGLPPGPDWTNANLASFLQSYRWHVLFAHSPKAFDIVAPLNSHGYHTTKSVPVMWKASLATMTPADVAWMERWETTFARWGRPLFTALLVEHLHDPDWDSAWDHWLNLHAFSFSLPLSLITTPGISLDTPHAMQVLERVMVHANTNLGDTNASETILHSHIFGILLGMKRTESAQKITPRADHQFGLTLYDANPESAIVFDALSDEGYQALTQAFPSALDWWNASTQERNLYLQKRVFDATSPAVKPVKAPSVNGDTKTFLATNTIRYAGIPNLVSYRQRALEALASGTLSKAQADKVRATLEQIRTTSLTATITLPQNWVDNFAKVHYRERKVVEIVSPALMVLGVAGLTQFADRGLALERTHLDHKPLHVIVPSQAITHLKTNPSMEGLDWAIATGLRHHDAIALMNATNPPQGWHEEILSQARFRTGWRDKDAQPHRFTTLVDSGVLWDINDGELRRAWFQVERDKPQEEWSLSVAHLKTLEPTGHAFFDTSMPRADLAGLLRFAIAAQDQDHAWFQAFQALAQRDGVHAGRFPLLKRWTAATAHQRLLAMRTFNDPDALLGMEPDAITALLKSTFGS